MEPAGAVAVVTGASAGIGAATAEALSRSGAKVVLVARRAERLADVADRCGPDALVVPADLADPAAADRVVASAVERYGRVDVVVNNAGVGLHKNAAETTVAEIEHVTQVNYLAAVRMTMAALPGMLERRAGVVVNVTSVAGYLPNPRESAYGAAKAALSLWSHGLAVDLHGTGVDVCVLSPGPIDTEIWSLDGSGATYRGKLFPPSVVADGVVSLVRKPQVQLTVPRRYGLPGAFYPLLGRPMRWGLRRYDAGAHRD